MYRSCGIIALFVGTALASPAAVVQTATARIEGKAILEGDHVTFDGKKIAWSQVHYLLLDALPRQGARSPHVSLKNGETWGVELIAMTGRKLEVRCDLFANKQVDVNELASLEFVPRSAPASQKLGLLYRNRGEPIPGKLLALTQDKLTLDSIVGELSLPRDGLVSYRFADVRPGMSQGEDEVVLIDGSLFKGKLKPDPKGLHLDHPLLGGITLPAMTIRSVVRHPAAMLDLTELTPDSIQTTSIDGGSRFAPLKVLRGAEMESDVFVKALVLEPACAITYKLPAKTGTKGRLRAMLLPLAEAQGDVRVIVQVGKKVELERKLAARTKAEQISLNVTDGDEIVVRVEFGERLRFPCAVVLGDPHVIWE